MEDKLIIRGARENNLKNINVLKNDDITRIVLSVDGYNGFELSNHLRKYGIEVESDSSM